jgi:hypothetical protein
MPLTPNQKKAAERARKRALGLTPLEIWARPEHHDKIKTFVLRLTKKEK